MPDEPEQRPVRIQDLVALTRPGDLDVSPDGELVAVTVSETDLARGEVRTQIHLAPDPRHETSSRDAEAEDGDEASRTRSAVLTRGFEDADTPLWSPDGSHLAFVTFRPQPHEDEDDDHCDDGRQKHQVFVIPSGPGEARRLSDLAEGVEHYRWWQDGSGVLALTVEPRPAAERAWRRRRRDNHDDPEVVYGEIPRLELWDVPLDGTPRRLLGGLRGVVDFEPSPDGRQVAIATTHTGRPEDADHVELMLHDLETGAVRAASGGRGGSENGPLFSPDGRFLFFVGWNDPEIPFSRHDVFAVDLEAPGDAPRALFAALDRDVEEYVVLADGRVAALLAWGLESRLALADPSDSARSPELSPLEGHQLSHLAAPRELGPLAAVAQSATRPPEVVRFRETDATCVPVSDLNPKAERWRLAERRRVVWSHGGFEHEGLLVRPARCEGDDPPPVLVWLHGGPHWRVVDTLDLYEAEAFAARGWAVFAPQYRGSSGASERYALALREDVGGAEADDVLAGLDAIVGEGLVDGDRAAVAGASYGGYLVNWLLATRDRFRAGISIAGIFDLAQDFGTSDHFTWELHYLGGAPWERPELYRARSPLTHADAITAPMLILHGIEDDNTYLTNSKALFRALRSLGREVVFVAYPREGHGIFEPVHRIDAFHRMVEWLDRHVGRPPRVRVFGTREMRDGLDLLVMGASVVKDYCGQRPREGRVFVEVSFVLSAMEDGPDTLRLVPSGPDADVVVLDERDGVTRPIGTVHETYGQAVLSRGHAGALEAWSESDGPPASLPATVVFELAEMPASYRLCIGEFEPVPIEVDPQELDGDETA
jgi:dipeptidyl aminopeptidase/acylaminoacyl peptidase